jgi:hypothetical protein
MQVKFLAGMYRRPSIGPDLGSLPNSLWVGSAFVCLAKKQKKKDLLSRGQNPWSYWNPNESKHNQYAPRRLRPIKKNTRRKRKSRKVWEKVKFPPCELMMSDPWPCVFLGAINPWLWPETWETWVHCSTMRDVNGN